MRIFALPLFVVASLSAQTVTCTTMFNQTTCSKVKGSSDYINPIIDSLKVGQEAQFRARQLKAQQEQFQQQMQLQRDQLQLQREQLKIEQERQRTAEPPTSSDQEQHLGEVNKTLQSLRERYPDFNSYDAKIAELANSFLPGKAVTMYSYVEGLYLIAKQSSAGTQLPATNTSSSQPSAKPVVDLVPELPRARIANQ
jgi:hypothetical protein